MPTLPIIPPSVPEGFCNTLGPDWIQQIINLMGQSVAVFSDVGTIVLNQEVVPNANQRDFLWFRPSTSIIYYWDTGTSAWISVHPDPPGSDVRRFWAGTLVDLESYDGGLPGPVGDNAGPMWEEDTDMPGRSPMHPGPIPSANPAKTLAVNENYGEGAHTLTQAELPDVTFPNVAPAQGDATGDIWGDSTGSDTGELYGDNGLAAENTAENPIKFVVKSGGSGSPLNVIHPVRGLYCIRRTARINYVGA